MTELLTSIYDGFRDRLKNPIVFALICAWLVWNWKPIGILIFSNESFEDHIFCIEQNYRDFWPNYFYPVCTAFGYLYIMPWLLMTYDKLVTRPNEARREMKLKSDARQIALSTKVVLARVEQTIAKANYAEAEDLRLANTRLINENESYKIQIKEINEIRDIEQMAAANERQTLVTASALKTKELIDKNAKEVMELNKVNNELKRNKRIINSGQNMQIHALQEYYALKGKMATVEFESIINSLKKVGEFEAQSLSDNMIAELHKHKLIKATKDASGMSYYALLIKGLVFWQEHLRETGENFIWFPSDDPDFAKELNLID